MTDDYDSVADYVNQEIFSQSVVFIATITSAMEIISLFPHEWFCLNITID